MDQEPEERSKGKVFEVDCCRINGAEHSSITDAVPVEEPIAVIINGEHSMDVAMSPCDIEDFTVGHLVCEGVISSPGEITCLETGSGWVEVKFDERGGSLRPRETIFSACFGSTGRRAGALDRIKSEIRVSPEQIISGVGIAMDSGTHRETGGVHTCAILRPGTGGEVEVVSMAEDIGRHTALDKAVGAALRKGVELAGCFLATTGRASSEMVAKCYGASLPVLCSRGATTTLAVEFSKMAGVTLVGFVRGSRMNVYSNGERIEGCE
jgi:formate dehydrogenase accessory protein FdhD